VLILGLVLFAMAARAATIDPARIAAIDQATDAFLAKAAAARQSGLVPRQSDPGVAALLDTVLNMRDLAHGPIDNADFPQLAHWLDRVVAVGRVYSNAARATHDTGLFAPELGRVIDAWVALDAAMADSVTGELDAHPGAAIAPVDRRKLAVLRTGIADNLIEAIDALRAPGVNGEWALERVSALRAAAPSAARFLAPADAARVRAVAIRLSLTVRDKPLRGALGNFAAALAAPAPPVAPPSDTAASAEIALESDARGLWVPVRINGAITIKFVVDSGAGIVVLPSDLVETLTKNGAIAPADMLGRNTYVTADGRRHKGTSVMLRELEVGSHRATNVLASVAPAHAVPLLGQTFLDKFKSWTLDNRRRVLAISE
jgi:clan AA aspartic protease (TIGR02281 family)